MAKQAKASRFAGEMLVQIERECRDEIAEIYDRLPSGRKYELYCIAREFDGRAVDKSGD